MKRTLTFWLNRIAFAIYLPIKALLHLMKKIFLGLVLLCFVIALAVSVWAYNATMIPLTYKQEARIHVKRGSSYHQVGDSLLNRGILKEKRWFLLIGRLTGADKRLRAGLFDIPTGLSTKALVEHLDQAKVAQIKVTLQEGILSHRMAAIFSRKLGTDSSKFVELVHDTAFAQKLVPKA
ncbi:MAG: endolytic transglycosylase MltG, partial [Calditrichota bacterium]